MNKVIFPIMIFFLIIPLVNAIEIPLIKSYVTDNANILSESSKQSLEETLRGLEKTTGGVQYVVYIEKEYPKEFSLEAYALKIAESNRIGKKGNDNGILLYIAINDKKYRWEVGYGVESTLNSPLLGRISREYLVPSFRKGRYEEGIIKVVDISTKILQGSNDPDIVKIKDDENTTKKKNIFFIVIIVSIIFIGTIFLITILFSKLAITKGKSTKHKEYNDNFYNGAAWGLFAGGFGRGGFGGSGGFGGFSGGGGGFGGGGHGSGW